MEKEIGVGPMLQVSLAFHRARCAIAAHGEGDVFVFCAIYFVSRHRLDEGNGFGDALAQLLNRGFVVFVLGRFHASQARHA